MLGIHRRWLETVIRARLGDSHAAEDVLQDLSMAVLRQSNRPTDQEKVAPWLYRIALRKVINHRRYLGRQRRLVEGFARHREHQECGNEDFSGGHWLMATEQRKDVQTALARINAADRQILMLKYSEGWSYKQLSEHLGISIKTVEYRLLRARDALRDELNRIDPKGY